jgi:hypothetical protein
MLHFEFLLGYVHLAQQWMLWAGCAPPPPVVYLHIPMHGIQSQLKHTALLLVLCIGCLGALRAQDNATLTPLFTSEKNILYVGPGFTNDQLILSFPQEIALVSISKQKILKKVHVPYIISSLYDVVLFDSLKQEIIVNPNFETQYLYNFGHLPIWNIKISFQKESIEALYPPDYFLSSGGIHLQSKSTLVQQQWVTVDSINYWVNLSTVVNYSDSLYMEFKKDPISAWSIDPNKRTALGFSSGKTLVLHPDYTLAYEDTNSKNAITRIEIHNNHLLYTGEGGTIYIVNLATKEKHKIQCANSIIGQFKCLPNSPYLVYQNESGRLCCYNYVAKETLSEYFFNLPALNFNNYTPLDSTSIAVLTFISSMESQVSRFDFKQLEKETIVRREAAIAHAAAMEEEKERTDMEFITAADTVKTEIIINQNFEYHSEAYLKPVYTDSSASYGLYADGNIAYVFQISSGNIIKKFNFPLEITEACMHTSGRYVAFSFEYHNSSYKSLDKIVVYDIANKRGQQYETQVFLGANTYSHIGKISFDASGEHIVFNPLGGAETPYNALHWRSGEYTVLKKTQPLTHNLDKSTFLKTPFAAILLQRSADVFQFDIHNHTLHIESFNGADFDINLKNLKTESKYKTSFCGQRIYDDGTDNPLWKKLGFKHGEYDWSYHIYPSIANDSIFHFEYKEQWYLVNAKNLEILQTYKNVFANQLHNYNAHTLAFALSKRDKTDKEEFLLYDLNTHKSELISKEKIESEISKTTGYSIKGDYVSNYFFVSFFHKEWILYTDLNSFFIYDAAQNKFVVQRLITGSFVEAASFNETENCLYIGCKNGNIFKLDVSTLTLQPFSAAGAGIKSLKVSGNSLYVLSEGNLLSIFSLKTAAKVASIYVFEDRNRQSSMAIVTPDLYYYSEKDALDALHISSTGMQVYEMSQFDILNNRPDKVLRALGFASEATCSIYEAAWKKRLRKLNIPEQPSENTFELPGIAIANATAIPNKTTQQNLTLQIQLHAASSPVNNLRIKINKVPIYGRTGISFSGVKDTQINLTLALSQGTNQIAISAVNALGIESYSSNLKVEYAPKKDRKPNLYVVTLGVSHYADTQYNLKFAAKDARDIQQYFTTQHPNYDSVFTLCLTDTSVSVSRLNSIRDFFSDSKREDAVVLAFAGHGLLSENYDYYLASHDIDFLKPETRGIPYEALENTMEGIASLQRAIFIDACHSGEVDKESLTRSPSAGNVHAKPVGRGSNLVVKGTAKEEVSKLASELFADLRNTTGATVISASGGLEFAMESADWNNGLFTYCLLHGLQDNEADDNNNQSISISELQQYLEKEVYKLSNGLQKPTSRIQNWQSDFPIK